MYVYNLFLDSELTATTGKEWEEEFSRKLLDFRISSGIKTSNPAATIGKENALAVRKDLPQMRPVDGSAIKSSRKALKTINHN